MFLAYKYHDHLCQLIHVNLIAAIEYPDFESDWTTMKSQSSTPELTTLTLDHDLGELPVLVDVQVKSMNEPNLDFIFPASGG